MPDKEEIKSVIHHIALSAADLARTADFYDAILAPLGYHRHLTLPQICTWHGPRPEVLIYNSRDDLRARSHATYQPGLHHLAFEVESREIVNRVFEAARGQGAKMLDAPTNYENYSQGYYAVYFEDPDHLKLEFAHIPNPTS